MAAQLPKSLEDAKPRRWGSEDGSGEPISSSFADYYKRFVYDRDFASAPEKRFNEFGRKSTTRPNIWQVYSNAIVPWNVIGHSDVATNDSGRLGRKSGDPGSEFEWSRVEALGLGMSSSATPIAPTLYASFFARFADESWRSGDNDTRRRFGGAVRTGIAGDPIRELQGDLQTIGYSVGGLDGDFGEKTMRAVEMFQEHFFAGGRGHKSPDGRVDRNTAVLIKQVVVAKAASLVGTIEGGALSGSGAANP